MNSIRIATSLFALAAAVFAVALPKVAIVAAAGSTAGDVRFTDPQTKLLTTGRFSQVDIIAANLTTPDLTTLQQYDAVIVWSNLNFQNQPLLSQNLADYVDGGGGVVLAVFANSTTTLNRYLTGRWQNGDLDVIPPAGGTTGGAASLGAVIEAGHPIMANVNALTASIASRPTSLAFRPGCTKIGQWSDGKMLAATHPLQNRCDIGLYPPSNLVSGSFWNQTGDGDDLMANALYWVCSTRGLHNNITVDQGLPFGGDLDSVRTSDDNSFFVLNEETAPNGQVTITGNVSPDIFGAMYLRTELGATRDDLSVFTEMFELNANTFITVATGTSSLVDQVQWTMVGSSVNYLTPATNTYRVRFRWVPQQDLEAADGWSETIDQVLVVANPG